MPRWLTILAVALVALLFAACGGDGGSDGGGNNPATRSSDDDDDVGAGISARDLEGIDLCKLLTRAEVEAAVGNPVEDGAPDLLISCKWDSDPDDTSVSMHLLRLPNAEICVNALKDDAVYDEQGGFGSPAFSSYNPVLGGLADVVVCTGGGQLQLTVSGGADDTPDEQRLRSTAIDLMKKALARI